MLFVTIIVLTMAQQPPTLHERIQTFISQMTDEELIQQLINEEFGTTPHNLRLGIPGFNMMDGPHGVRGQMLGKPASAFPVGLAMCATFDEQAVYDVGKAMGTEFWAFGYDVCLGPCIDIARDPRGGRTAESGGEDVYLAGHIGKQYVLGIESEYVIGTIKHFMGESKQTNGRPGEPNSDQEYRHKARFTTSERWLMDFNMYNFRTAMQESGGFNIMNSYNYINGIKLSENEQLNNEILREKWGFQFYIVSDWNNILQFRSFQAVKCTDVCMGDGDHVGSDYKAYEWELPDVIKTPEGKADITRAVYRVLKSKIMNGMLDPKRPARVEARALTPEIEQVNYSAAQKTVILLKNEQNILPLPKIARIAVIGPNSEGWNLNCWGSSETLPPYAFTVLDGIREKVGASYVTFVKGCEHSGNDTSGFEAARTAARNSNYVIFAGGINEDFEGEGYMKGWDREQLQLPPIQQELIRQLYIVNPNLIAVFQGGGILSIDDATHNSIRGFVYSFYAAQFAGKAIADVIFGDYNPAGRLPQTMPINEAQLPAWDLVFDKPIGYQHNDEYNIVPRYAFGFGLSYTTFRYSNLRAPTSLRVGEPFDVSVDVTNTGLRDGDEVVQLYITFPRSDTLWFPRKELRGFRRIPLKAGESQTVTIPLVADDLYYWNVEEQRYRVRNGDYVLRVGGSSDNLPLSSNLRLLEYVGLPDLKITRVFTLPRFPAVGDRVRFYALVKNQGNLAVQGNYRVAWQTSFCLPSRTSHVCNIRRASSIRCW